MKQAFRISKISKLQNLKLSAEFSFLKFEIIPDENTLYQFVDLVQSIGPHFIMKRTFDVDNVNNHIIWRIHCQLFLFVFWDPFWVFARERLVIPIMDIVSDKGAVVRILKIRLKSSKTGK